MIRTKTEQSIFFQSQDKRIGTSSQSETEKNG